MRKAKTSATTNPQILSKVCHGDICHPAMGTWQIYLKNNHICQLQEIVVTPDIEFARVNDKSLYILLNKIYIG
jgi:hypothetical protein